MAVGGRRARRMESTDSAGLPGAADRHINLPLQARRGDQTVLRKRVQEIAQTRVR